MLNRILDLVLGPAARAGDWILDQDLSLVMPVNGHCAARPTHGRDRPAGHRTSDFGQVLIWPGPRRSGGASPLRRRA